MTVTWKTPPPPPPRDQPSQTMKDGDAKLKTSFAITPSMEHSMLDRQMSTNSAIFENPFREGGEVSKDAENILVAYRQGKLSVISTDGYRLSQTEDELDSLGQANISSSNNLQQNSGLNFSSGQNSDTAFATELNSSDLNDSVLRDRKNGMSKKDKPGVVEVQHGHVPNAKKEEAEKINIPEKEKKGCCLLM